MFVFWGVVKIKTMQDKFNIKKRLGQNFLINKGIIKKIVERAEIKDSVVIEIGPGFGALTKELLKTAKKVIAVEKDEEIALKLKDIFKEQTNFEFIFGDFLKIDLQKIVNDNIKYGNVKICANLPYYITSLAIVKILETNYIKSATLMVQKEAAKRLCAKPGDKNCGSISVFVNYYSYPKIMFNVSKRSFFPVPKVDSSVIQLILKNTNKTNLKEEVFFRLVRASFGKRRKKITNPVCEEFGLKKEYLVSILKKLGLSGEERAENLTLEQFIVLSNFLS